MRSIDLAKIIEDLKLDEEALASELFPNHRHPALALKRVKKGDGLLNSKQISRLATIADMPIGALFGVQGWEYEIKDGIYILQCDNFKAELDTNSWVTKIYDSGSLFHDEVIHGGTTTLSEYVTKLNLIINKYRENEQIKN